MERGAAIARTWPAWMKGGISLNPRNFETFRAEEKPVAKLTDLEARFIVPSGLMGSTSKVEGFDEAQGVRFLCPLCNAHMVLIWFDGKCPLDSTSSQQRWRATGAGLNDLTLSPSINFDIGSNGCRWHGWVTNGEAK